MPEEFLKFCSINDEGETDSFDGLHEHVFQVCGFGHQRCDLDAVADEACIQCRSIRSLEVY